MPSRTSSAPGDSSPAELMRLMTGFQVSQAISVAAKLGLADLLAAGPRHVTELAAATKTDAPSLARLLRALSGVEIVAEVAPGRFAVKPRGELLQTGVTGSLRGFAILVGEELSWRPWGHLLHSVRTGTTAFEHVWGMGSFAYFETHPIEGEIFNEAMVGLTAPVASALGAAYDFAAAETIVDVGGGQGALLAALLSAYAHLRGVLLDLPHVVEKAGDLLAAGVRDRCTILGGDFFAEIPSGDDVYLLSRVVHDWDDEHAARILRACREAMAGRGAVLLVERHVPSDAEQALPALLSDLNMLVVLGGRERTDDEYRRLLATANLRLARVQPLTPPYALFEATPA